MVILPLLFELCDFTLAFVKRSSRLPLLVTPFGLVGLNGKKKRKKRNVGKKDNNTPKVSSFLNGSNWRTGGEKHVSLPG